MEKIYRLLRIYHKLQFSRYPVSRQTLMAEFNCSEKTIKRDISELNTLLNAEITYEKNKGYTYNAGHQADQLPGVLLSPTERLQLHTLLQLIESYDNAALNQDLQSIKQYIISSLESQNIELKKLSDKIKFISSQRQTCNHKHLVTLYEALRLNKRVAIEYIDKRQQKTQREISPQQLVHYQENWYIDNFCHKRNALRLFQVANIIKITLTDNPATVVPHQERQQHFTTSYGIYAGKPTQTVTLSFTGHTAHHMTNIKWHPQQTSHWKDNRYIISFPYHKDNELVGDILKHGNDVTVLEPIELRDKIKNRIEKMQKNYQ